MRHTGGSRISGWRFPSHGTIVAYVALFFALCGSGFAATTVIGHIASGVKVRCSATRGRKRIACAVIGTTGSEGTAGLRGPTGATGATGSQGPPGTSLNGPTVLTQPPAYVFDPNNNPGFLTTPFTTPTPDRYFEQQYTVAEDSNVENDLQNDVYTSLLSPSQIGGSTLHLSSVQFCIDISPNSNTGFHGTSTVSVDKATVYEVNEPNPGGGSGSGTAGPPLAYPTPTALLQQSYTGETDINSCLTASTSTPVAINPDGYLVFAITLGLTDSGTNNSTYGTNYIQFGRVTTTYTP